MEFRETLLAAQKNSQQHKSGSNYYKARFDPPKKEQKQKDRLSANIQKFLAKKDEEEKLKKLEVQRKRDELLAMRDPKALRKIQKTLKVIKSANKSVLEDAIDRDNTAVTLTGPEQPDQDDYGYESQEAAALYQKMMQKYSKIPDVPKFPVSNSGTKKDLNGVKERVKQALQHEDEPVPHKRRRRNKSNDRESSPPTKYEHEPKKDNKPEKPKIRKSAPPPMDFNQLLKLAEQKKSEPIEMVAKKQVVETEKERLMTKKQKREYEEEMARRQRRMQRMEAEKSGSKKVKEERHIEKDKKPEPAGFGKIPKLGGKSSSNKNESPKVDRDRERDRHVAEKDKTQLEREKLEKRLKAERERIEKDLERLNMEKKLLAEKERINRDLEKLNRDKEKLEKLKSKFDECKPEKTSKSVDRIDKNKMPSKDGHTRQDSKNIDLKSQNTYRIDKNSNDKKFVIPSKSGDSKYINGHISQMKPTSKQVKDAKDKVTSAQESPKINGQAKPHNGQKSPNERGIAKGPLEKKPTASSSQPINKQKITNTFDFDNYVSSLKNYGAKRQPSGPGAVKRKPHPDDLRKKQKRRVLDSESDYDSEMDDFIDDGDENMPDISREIQQIFGYDKTKYRHIDDEDDPEMESSFARQQREEYISKKIGIMEDLEDMRMEAEEKKKKKKRRISDD